jgi:hypothetical protein
MRSTSSYRTRTAVSCHTPSCPPVPRSRSAVAIGGLSGSLPTPADNLPDFMDSVLSPAMDAPPPTALRPSTRRKSVALAAVLGWAVPGLGHAYVGQPLKALLFFAAIVPTFAIGLALTDFTCVNPQKYTLEFVAHAWLGGPTAVAMHWTKDHLLDSMPRWFDVGRLYAAVAGLLNVVALSDVMGVALARNRIVDRMRRRQSHPATWGEPLPSDLPPGSLVEAPALMEIDDRDAFFSAVDEAAGGGASEAAPPARPAITGDVLLDASSPEPPAPGPAEGEPR